MIPVATTFGFNWGPVKVTRIAHFEPRRGRESYILDVNGLDIYVSKTGRSVRVFRDGKELK
jgi:hypothetical protein